VLGAPQAVNRLPLVFILTDGQLDVGQNSPYSGWPSSDAAGNAAAQKLITDPSTGILHELRDIGAGIWPVGFGQADKGELSLFAGGGAQNDCPAGSGATPEAAIVPPSVTGSAENREVEDFLRETIDVGAQPGEVHYEFRPTAAEALTVVMIRTALGVTDITEARQVMSTWADALRTADVQDSLRWRQRLGYDYGWLLTTEDQRVSILQRLLIAMRNGWIDVLSGKDEWPTEIAIRASADSGSGAARLEVPLRPWDEASPWGDLLHSYEESILAGDELNRQEMYRRLMGVLPVRNSDDGRATEAAPLYKAFLKVQEEELAKLESLLAAVPPLDPDQRLQVAGLRDYWKLTVPAALHKKIAGYAGLRNTLAALD